MTTTAERVTPQELARAWEALRAGQFRPPTASSQQPQRPAEDDAGRHWWQHEPAVAVVAGHGWSGASTTALLLAHAYTVTGVTVRLLDGATPARSGLVAAALTEHGLDATGRWRLGSRDGVQVQRPAEQVPGPADLPDAGPGPHPSSCTVSVVDTGWPVGQLVTDPGWLGGLLGAVPVVVTARASALGLRHAEATLAQLHAVGATAVVVALLGPTRRGRVPSRVASAAGPRVTQVIQERRMVMLPQLAALAGDGIGASDLPRRLGPAGAALVAALGPLNEANTLDSPAPARPPDPMREKGML